MAIKNLSKLPKRKVTVDELLFTDDVRDLLRELFEKRNEIDQIVVAYTDKGNVVHTFYQGTVERVLWAMEFTKQTIIQEAMEGD